MVGKHREIVGPERVWMFWSTIRFLDQHVASPQQYVIIQFKDGHSEHLKGPTLIYRNPVLHMSVTVCDAIQLLSSTDVLVVYRAAPDMPRSAGTGAGGLTRTRLTGPASYVPAPGEVVHSFVWSGKGEGGNVVKGVNRFQILRTGPQRWALSIRIITADKASATVQVYPNPVHCTPSLGAQGACGQVLVHYQLREAEGGLDRLLDAADPMDDLHTALQTDLARLAAAYDSADLLDSAPRPLAARSSSTRQSRPFHT
jgi:hypothetical protein